MSADNLKDQSYMHEREAAVYTPAAQAVVSCLVTFALAYTLASAFRVRDALMPSLAVAVVVGALFWFGRFVHWYRLTIIIMENIFRQDINQDGVIGEPVKYETPAPAAPKVVAVKHYYHDKNGNLTGMDTAEYDPEIMRKVAAALARNVSFSVGAMVESSKTITRAEFDKLAADLLATGDVEWKNASHKNLGYRPTEKGRETFARFHSPVED